MMTTDTVRSASAEIPVALTIAERNSVKKVKLAINPTTTPHGRFLPPVIDEDSTMGRIGKMQGERMVTMPARNANRMRSMISCYVKKV